MCTWKITSHFYYFSILYRITSSLPLSPLTYQLTNRINKKSIKFFQSILFHVLLYAPANLSSSSTMMTFIPSVLVLHVVDQIPASVRFRFKLVLEAIVLRVPLLLVMVLVELVRLIRPNVPALHLPPLPIPFLVIIRHRLRIWWYVVHVLVHRVTVTLLLLLQIVALRVERRGIFFAVIVDREVLLPAPFLIRVFGL